MADLCFGLLMPLIIGLMMSEFVLIDQLLLRGWDMVFCLRFTGHWFGRLSYELYNVCTKCFCREEAAFKTLDGSALLALMHLFILVISFLFIPEHCGWTHCPHLLQLIQSILFCFRLLVFLIIADSVSGWFLLHMWHIQLQSLQRVSYINIMHSTVNIIWVNQQSVDNLIETDKQLISKLKH